MRYPTTADPVVVVARADQGRFYEEGHYPVVPGQNLYGARLRGPVTFNPQARSELVRAVWLVRWYEQALLTRFHPDEDVTEITEILEVLK